MALHQDLDETITKSILAIQMVFNHPSSVRRLWGISDELIEAKHYLNVVAKYKKAESIRVVDVGCGQGKLLANIAEYFQNAECIGLDQNELSVSIARNRTGNRGRVELGGFERAKEFGEFDVTICSEVFEHVLDTSKLLDVLVEITRPGGIVTISTPSGWMYHFPFPSNFYRFLKSPRRFLRIFLRPEKQVPLVNRCEEFC